MIVQKGLNIVCMAILAFLGFLCLNSCESFLEVEVDKSQIPNALVYSNDVTATSAMTGVYCGMLDISTFSSGSDRSLTCLGALSSDDFYSYSTDPDVQEIYRNSILPDNSRVLVIWRSLYKTIYEANAVLEGVSLSEKLTSSVKSQLEGEARFVRAFCNFYLVNVFGNVPLVVDTDYKKNSLISKSNIDDIYDFIEEDLVKAKGLLGDDYITEERVRPNKFAAATLLARVFLYRGNWNDAQDESSYVLSNALYNLESTQNVFLKGSQETIWQLMPVNLSRNTLEGFFFILKRSPIGNSLQSNALTDDLVQSFEDGDLRKTDWISSYTAAASGQTWFFPFKYKIQVGGTPLNEYSVVLRLSELYLIRAEARAQLDDLTGAVADLDSVRVRASLPTLEEGGSVLGRDEILGYVAQERRAEFFLEWGHRWFDLCRTRKAGDVLGQKKSEWSEASVRFPIPQVEHEKNPRLDEIILEGK